MTKLTSEYEADIIKLIRQIADDIRWLRRHAEERDRTQKQEDEDLLRQIEKTHRGPTKLFDPFGSGAGNVLGQFVSLVAFLLILANSGFRRPGIEAIDGGFKVLDQ